MFWLDAIYFTCQLSTKFRPDTMGPSENRNRGRFWRFSSTIVVGKSEISDFPIFFSIFKIGNAKSDFENRLQNRRRFLSMPVLWASENRKIGNITTKVSVINMLFLNSIATLHTVYWYRSCNYTGTGNITRSEIKKIKCQRLETNIILFINTFLYYFNVYHLMRKQYTRSSLMCVI